MLDRAGVTPTAEWPPAFAETFIEQARRLLDLSQVLMILGPIGGSAHSLAAGIVGAPGGADTALWSHHIASIGDSELPFHAIRCIFTVDVQADPTDIDISIRADLAIAGESPAVIIANADLCDRESIATLARLAAAGALRLVLTLPAESLTSFGELAAVAEVVELPPLEPETVSEMIRIRYAVTPAPALVNVLMERTGGSYEVLCDVVDNAWQTQQLAVRDDQLVVDNVLAAPATTPPSDDLSQLTAVLGQLDLAEAIAVWGRDAVVAAVASDALTGDADHIAFSSAAESRRVRSSLPRHRLAELFDLYAHQLPLTVADSAVAAAEWWRSTGHLLPPDLASQAARQANLLGHPRRAIMFTDPDQNTTHAVVAPLERTYAMAEVGDTLGVSSTWMSIHPESLTEDELLPYLGWVHRLADADQQDLLVAQAVQADETKASDRRLATNSLAVLVDRAFSAAATDLAGPLRELLFSDRLSTRNRALAFAAMSAVLLNSGRPAQAAEMGQLASEILKLTPGQVSAFHLDVVREIHVRALITALDIAGAERAMQSYAQAGAEPAGRITSMLLALIATMRGNTRSAIAMVRRGLIGLHPRDPHNMSGWNEAHLAYLLTLTDQSADAQLALQRSEQCTPHHGYYGLERQIALAAALDALAEPEDALSLLDTVVTEAKEHGLLLIQIEAAARSVLIGGPPLVKVLTEAVEGLTELTGVPAFWQQFAAAARLYDIGVLTRLIEELVADGAFGLAADIAQFVLDMSRRSTDLDPETRMWLRDLAERQELS